MVRKLRVWQKLGIIGLAFTIPLALTTYFLVDEQSIKIDFARAELDGIEYLRPLANLEVNIAAHEAARVRVARGDASGRAQEAAAEAAVNAAFAKLAEVDARLGEKLQTDAEHLVEADRGASLPSALRARWQTVRNVRNTRISDQGHRELIADVRDLITHVGDTSKLILDPDLDTYYTMDALLLQEPAIVDLLSAANQFAQALSSRRGVTVRDRNELSDRAAILESRIEELRTDLETAFREADNFSGSKELEPTLSPLLADALAPTAVVNELQRSLARGNGRDPSQAPRIARAASDALNAHARLWTGLLDQEVDMLQTRESGDLRRRWTALLTVLVALLLTAGLMVWVARRIVNDVGALASAARGLATGDLTVRAPVNSEDEIGRLAVDFNEMAARLEELSAQVRDGAAGINAAATDILSAVSQQTAGAAQQSAAISEISHAVERIRATAELMLDKALEMAEQGQASLAISREGTEAVEAIREGMVTIRDQVQEIASDIVALAEQTEQIGEITALVSDLADQSNLLALNANIEAAKAGEQGKGFAVVAAQVRLLAEQSKQATSDVSAILTEIRNAANAAVVATEAGTKVVEDGMTLAGRAGRVIGQLGETIAQTAQSGAQIADGAQAQKAGIEQISQAINDVNETTSRFATGAEESEGTAQGLTALAGPLRELTERYKVTASGDGGKAQ